MPGNGRRHSAASLAKTAEPIEIMSQLWTRVRPSKHLLDGGPDPPCEGAVLRGKNMHGQEDSLPRAVQKWPNRSRHRCKNVFTFFIFVTFLT